MIPLRVLITNLVVAGNTGTEMYVRDLALGLLRRGHTPIVYSPRLGALAEQLRQASIPVVDDLNQVQQAPDVIHGHHSLETLTALLRFPSTPAIFVCHDCSAWHDKAPQFPRITHYVGVDQACYDRLTLSDGIPADRVRIVQNAVDVKRFQPRSPLPEKPQRALLFSNYCEPQHARILESACIRHGIQLDTIGRQLSGICHEPEQVLPQYDLVFAKGRCAWEALTVGTALIVCDAQGMGSLVTVDQLELMRRLNFGRRLLCQPLSEQAISEQIVRYQAGDANEVSRRIRQVVSLDRLLDQLTELYLEAMDQVTSGACSTADEFQATADILQWWGTQREELIRQRSRRNRWGKWYRSVSKRLAKAHLSWRQRHRSQRAA